jgi:hypothetical protein
LRAGHCRAEIVALRLSPARGTVRHPRAGTSLLALGANLSFDERFAVELRTGDGDGLLARIHKIHDAMLDDRQPALSSQEPM